VFSVLRQVMKYIKVHMKEVKVTVFHLVHIVYMDNNSLKSKIYCIDYSIIGRITCIASLKVYTLTINYIVKG